MESIQHFFIARKGLTIILYGIAVGAILSTVGYNLLPHDRMFMIHDKTQFVRVLDFANELKASHIPPIFSHQLNFGIEYPVFLFYAPLAYWISSGIYFIGVDLVNAVRLSFLFAMIVGWSGMFVWQRVKYVWPAALASATLFIASPWFASEIFVRGNLATAWFLAFAPWSLWGLTRVRKMTLVKSMCISASLIAHSALSLFWIPILLMYSLFAYRHHRTHRILLVLLSMLMTSFFWLPSLTQIGQTYAQDIAKSIVYRNHFLCLSQIWTSPAWGFGGSAPGCTNDGMSFMVGKIQLILAGTGLTSGFFMLPKRRRLLFEGLIVICTIFLTLFDSSFIWQTLSPMQVVQFPWRFLSISLIFIASLSSATFQILHKHLLLVFKKDRLGIHKWYKKWGTFVGRPVIRIAHTMGYAFILPPIHTFIFTLVSLSFAILVLIYSMKFFYGLELPMKEYTATYASPEFARNKSVYEIQEYVPRTVNYSYWLSFRNHAPSSQERSILQKQFTQFKPSPLLSMFGGILSLVSLVIILCLLR